MSELDLESFYSLLALLECHKLFAWDVNVCCCLYIVGLCY